MEFILQGDPITFIQRSLKEMKKSYQENHSNLIFFHGYDSTLSYQVSFKIFLITFPSVVISTFHKYFPPLIPITPFNYHLVQFFPLSNFFKVCYIHYLYYHISYLRFSICCLVSIFLSPQSWNGQTHTLSDSKYYSYVAFMIFYSWWQIFWYYLIYPSKIIWGLFTFQRGELILKY